MGLLKNFLGKRNKTKSVVLIDAGADSVAGAYVFCEEKETPKLVYSQRIPINFHKGEPHEQSMLRTLSLLGNELIKYGAPQLLRFSGSGRADSVIVSVDSPWEEVKMRSEKLERKDSFIFTKDIVNNVLKNTTNSSQGRQLVNESIISTILNGYETFDPYGKEIRQASFVVLSSFIDTEVLDPIKTTIRGIFHNDHIFLIAGRSLRYQSIRAVFSHENNALIIDVTENLTSISLVRKNLLVEFFEVSHSTADIRSWTKAIKGALTKLSERYPLPKVLFLLVHEPESSLLRQAFEEISFSQLWPSDSSPKIVQVSASHVSNLVRQIATSPPDLQLLLMAFYYDQVCERK